MLANSICVELIDNVVAAGPNTSNGFFQAYYLPLLSDMFFVLTDADHKSGKSPYLYFLSLAITQLIDAFTIGFKSTALVLARLIRLVETGDIQVPLDPSVTSAPGNSAFVAEHSANLLKQAFPHLQLFVLLSLQSFRIRKAESFTAEQVFHHRFHLCSTRAIW